MVESNQGNNSYDKGIILELLAKHLIFTIPGAFIKNRVSTNSTEIDLLVEYRNSQLDIMNNRDGYMISECKYYSSRINVTHIMKFIRLLEINKINLGIFISWEGVSPHAMKQIERAVDTNSIYVISVDKEDILQLIESSDIISIIRSKYESLRFDIKK